MAASQRDVQEQTSAWASYLLVPAYVAIVLQVAGAPLLLAFPRRFCVFPLGLGVGALSYLRSFPRAIFGAAALPIGTS